MQRTPVLRSLIASSAYVCPSCLHTLSRVSFSSRARRDSSSTASQDTEIWGNSPPSLGKAWDNNEETTDLKTALQRIKHSRPKPSLPSAVADHDSLSSSPGHAKPVTSEANEEAPDGPFDDKRSRGSPFPQQTHGDPKQSRSLRDLRLAREATISARMRLAAVKSAEPGGFSALDSASEDIGDHTVDDSGAARGSKDTLKTRTKKKDKKASKSSRRTWVLTEGTIKADDISIDPIESDLSDVPKLSYGLERVLFNPGFYFLQDPRSRVFNFDPYLEMIMPVSDFDFSALKKFTPSSKDARLAELTQSHGARYCGSTSSMTGLLSHFHFLLSSWREINTEMLSAKFPVTSKNFTQIQRGPAATILRYNEERDTYAIDADKTFSSSNVLSMLGMSMEKLLTMETVDYERYRLSNSEPVTQQQLDQTDTYHFSTAGDFMFRSQLDARDPRLPGSGVFDLKTRAVIPIRMNVKDYEQMKGYEITGTMGEYESVEREYHDMIRAVFLKYSMQVRMGRMDGIFVAYHNTERIFGFQYIPLSEMDLAIHGQRDTLLGDQEFKFSLKLLNELLDMAAERYPKQSLRLHCEMRASQLYFFAEPVTQSEIDELNVKKAEEERRFEETLRADDMTPSGKSGIVDAEVEEPFQAKSELSPLEQPLPIATELDAPSGRSEITSKDEICDDSPQLDTQYTNSSNGGFPETADQEDDSGSDHAPPAEFEYQDPSTAPVDAGMAGVQSSGPAQDTPAMQTSSRLEPIGVVSEMPDQEHPPPEEPPATEVDVKDDGAIFDNASEDNSGVATSAEDHKAVLALTVRVRNKVGNKVVPRATNIHANSEPWTVEYDIIEAVDTEKSWAAYQACKRRRAVLLGMDKKNDRYNMTYIRHLRKLSNRGKAYRKQREREDQGKEKFVLGKTL